MNKFFVFALALVSFADISYSSVNYPNEPAGFITISERAFNAKAENGWGDEGYASFSIVQDATAPKSPSSVGQGKFAANYPGGGVILNWLSVESYRTTYIYYSFWMKLSDNFFGYHSGVNKIGFVWIDNLPMVFYTAYGVGNGTLTSQIRLQNTLVAGGARNLGANISNRELVRGKWIRWEVLLTANTPGQSNGRAQWWLDGNLVGSYADVGLVKAGSEPFWNFVSMQPMSGDNTEDQFIWFDHFYVSHGTSAPEPVLTSINVPHSNTVVAPLSAKQFSATALDQYGQPMASQPTFAWAVSGGGSISSTGLFTAGSSAGGPYTVTASADGKSGTVQFSVGDAVGKGAFIGTYFRNKDLTDPVLSRLDQTIDFNWGGGVPDPSMPKDSFSVRWEGDFTFASAGTFPFTATADDGIRVYLDGTMIINQWKNQIATTYTVNQVVTAGTHRIKVEYYDWKYDAVCKVSFTGAAQAAIANRPVSNSKLSIDLLRQSGNSLEFGVSAAGKVDFDLSITGADGRKIWKSRSHADVRSVFCSPSAANGLYFVTLTQGAHQVIRKIAVIR